jgi:hypothetical protein
MMRGVFSLSARAAPALAISMGAASCCSRSSISNAAAGRSAATQIHAVAECVRYRPAAPRSSAEARAGNRAYNDAAGIFFGVLIAGCDPRSEMPA